MGLSAIGGVRFGFVIDQGHNANSVPTRSKCTVQRKSRGRLGNRCDDSVCSGTRTDFISSRVLPLPPSP